MISAVCFGTNDLERAGAFYDVVLATLGMVRIDANENEIGYGKSGAAPSFWILKPFDTQPATHGNGTQVIMDVTDSNTVDLFHQTALAQGGTDEGGPGLRDHTPGYYGAYCRDLDGNKLHVVAMLSPA